MVSALEALELLARGNERFVSGAGNRACSSTEKQRLDLVSGQDPCAVVLGCSDSRVPVEIVFDQGPGDLFVIRVAGHVAASSQVGSVEYAVEMCGTRLVVVLGHTGCGAVTAAVDEVLQRAQLHSPHLRGIVDWIRPAVESASEEGLGRNREALIARAIRSNIRASVARLRAESEILEARTQQGHLLVVGAEYSLETGVVDFFEGAD